MPTGRARMMDLKKEISPSTESRKACSSAVSPGMEIVIVQRVSREREKERQEEEMGAGDKVRLRCTAVNAAATVRRVFVCRSSAKHADIKPLSPSTDLRQVGCVQLSCLLLSDYLFTSSITLTRPVKMSHLNKPNVYSVEDTNIALFGSDVSTWTPPPLRSSRV